MDIEQDGLYVLDHHFSFMENNSPAFPIYVCLFTIHRAFVRVYVVVHTCVHMCRSQRLTSGAFDYCSLLYFLQEDLSLNLELVSGYNDWLVGFGNPPVSALPARWSQSTITTPSFWGVNLGRYSRYFID